MRIVSSFALLFGLLLIALPLHAEEGQGTADPSAAVDGLNLGTYWYGREIDKRALIGKVVLVEIWGS